MPDHPIAVRTVNQHSIARLHLSERVAPAAIPQVASAMIGIHAARLQSPVMSMAARVEGANASELAHRLNRSRELIKLRCMRGTLHIAPLDLAPILHVATRKRRLSVCRSLGRSFAVAPGAEAAVGEAMLSSLHGRLLTSGEIVEEVDGLATRRTGLMHAQRLPYLRYLIKTLWESGELYICNPAADWTKEARVYGLLSDGYPGLDLHGVDAGEATAALLSAYFRRYGPASAADAAWWSGLGEARVRSFLADNDRWLVAVRVEGLNAPCYLDAEDRDALHDLRPGEANVEFLAYEDNLLKGYKESRLRFLAEKHYNRIFNRIGEALPTILIDGRIAGVWQFDKKARGIAYNVFGSHDRRTTELIESRRRRLEDLLSTVVPGIDRNAKAADRGGTVTARGFSASSRRAPADCRVGPRR